MDALPTTPAHVLGRLVKRYVVRLRQLVASPWDFLCAISTAPLWEFDPRPPLYYWCCEDAEYYYLGIVLYHRYDAASFHEHDFEGIILKISKTLHRRFGDDQPARAVRACACVNHLQFNWYQAGPAGLRLWFEIEAKGHGISLYTGAPGALDREHNLHEYSRFAMGPENNLRNGEFQGRWEELRQQFNPWVKLPDQWVDMVLEPFVRKRRPQIWGERISTTRGLLWTRPDLAFELAAKRKILRQG